MILGFKEFFDKEKTKPTYFREKICVGAGYTSNKYDRGPGLVYFVDHPKIHTIREGSRWKAGDLMHMAYGVRTKDYRQFNKDIPELQVVKSVQRIEIKPVWEFAMVYIDGIYISEDNQLDRLVINDGFASQHEFFSWFNKDFSGQIIHFTNFKY